MKTTYVSIWCALLVLRIFLPDVFNLVASWHWWAIWKLLVWLPLIIYSFEILGRIKDNLKTVNLEVITEKAEEHNALDELVTFIIENKGLPVEKARSKFWRSGEKCKEIGSKLEEWGILGRGKDNARILIQDDPQVIEFWLHYPTERVAI